MSEGTVIALVTGLEKGQFGGRAITLYGSTGQDKQNGKNPEPCSLQTRSLGARCLRCVFFCGHQWVRQDQWLVPTRDVLMALAHLVRILPQFRNAPLYGCGYTVANFTGCLWPAVDWTILSSACGYTEASFFMLKLGSFGGVLHTDLLIEPTPLLIALPAVGQTASHGVIVVGGGFSKGQVVYWMLWSFL